MSFRSKLDSRPNKQARYLELVDFLEVVCHSVDLDLDLSQDTKSDLQESLAHAETALRRALAETHVSK